MKILPTLKAVIILSYRSLLTPLPRARNGRLITDTLTLLNNCSEIRGRND